MTEQIPSRVAPSMSVPRWRLWRRGRRAVTSLMSPDAKVLLWVVVSLLPLVGGAGMAPGLGAGTGAGPGPRPGAAPGRALGGRDGERELPVTLPEVTEEEREDHGDPYPTSHAIYDPYVIDEADDHPSSSRWASRFPRSSSSSYDTSEPPPRGAPRKRKRKKKGEEGETERGRGERGRGGRGKKAGHAPSQSSRDCRVEKREMKVRDLGLGFDSDEIVLFKFCVGSCQSLRTNYDLALNALLQNGVLLQNGSLLPRRRVSSQPCCRPDRYEPVSFMDAQTTWRTIQSLSAASCMCMG